MRISMKLGERLWYCQKKKKIGIDLEIYLRLCFIKRVQFNMFLVTLNLCFKNTKAYFEGCSHWVGRIHRGHTNISDLADFTSASKNFYRAGQMGLLKIWVAAHRKQKTITEICNAFVHRVAENYEKQLKNCLL